MKRALPASIESNDALRRPAAVVAIPAANLYGSDRVMLETVNALVADGWSVTVTTPVDGPLLDRLPHEVDVVIVPTLVLRRTLMSPAGLPRMLSTFVANLIAGWRLVRRTRSDVLYVSTLTIPVWLFVARLTRRPSVCHVHEGEASESRLVLRTMTAPLFLADQLLVNSQFARDVLGSAFRPLRDRAQVVYNSIPGPHHPPTPPRTELSGAARLVFIGRLAPRKGAHVAIDAVDLLRARHLDVRLDVVGEATDDGYRTDLEDQVRDLELENFIVFHGFQADVWRHLEDCDIALVPATLPETFGNTAVEAALAERPRVISDFPGLQEASANMRASVLVVPEDAESLARGIEDVVRNWSVYRDLAAGDREYAESAYTRTRFGTEVMASLNSVTSVAANG